MNKLAALKLPDYIQLQQKKVRYARLKVHTNGDIILVVPLSASVEHIQQWLLDKQPWIDRQRAEHAARQARFIQLNEQQFLLHGQAYQLVVDSMASKTPTLDPQQHTLTGACLDNATLERWFKRYARQYLTIRLNELSVATGLRFTAVSVREQKSRWGSCSAARAISLNRRLVRAPHSVADYVMIHELAHTQIMNHSPAFWQLVAQHDPEYQASTAWLKNYGGFI